MSKQNEPPDYDTLLEEVEQLRLECRALRQAQAVAANRPSRERLTKNYSDSGLCARLRNLQAYLRNYVFLTQDEIRYIEGTGKPRPGEEK